jgi:hypothetical protein
MVLWTMACADYQTVDEACSDNVRGAGSASAAAVELIGRVSCYRKLAGLDRANLNSRIGEAVENHANYLLTNEVEVFDPSVDWWAETFGELGFTGTDAYERLYATEYLVEDVGSAFVWEVLTLVDETQTYTEGVDDLMLDFFFRDVFLAPAWEGAGYTEFPYTIYGEELTLAYMNVVLYFPSGAHALNPVVYPVAGQLDVPLGWPNDYAANPYDTTLDMIPADAGLPITFTFGSNTVGAGLNPLSVSVVSSAITSASGPVEHIVVLPGSYAPGTLWSTAALIPTEPLLPNTTYTVAAELSWIERSNHLVTTTFTTGGAL